jgi:hypothetical protein
MYKVDTSIIEVKSLKERFNPELAVWGDVLGGLDWRKICSNDLSMRVLFRDFQSPQSRSRSDVNYRQQELVKSDLSVEVSKKWERRYFSREIYGNNIEYLVIVQVLPHH